MQPKMKKIVIASSIIGAIVIVASAIAMNSKRKKLQAKVVAGSPDVIEPAKSTSGSVIFPLKKGMGTTVAEKSMLHWWLQVTSLDEDGIFGALTESSLYKLAGVKEVSYSLYKEMQGYLTPTTASTNVAANMSSDPYVQKNSLLTTNTYTLFQ
jgi:hypothetical protein